MDSVQLTDLDVITKYSIAVRKASANRDELIETLRADLSWLERGHRVLRPAPVALAEPAAAERESEAYEDEVVAEPEPSRAPLRRMPANVRATPRKVAAKRAPEKKVAAKKTAVRRSR